MYQFYIAPVIIAIIIINVFVKLLLLYFWYGDKDIYYVEHVVHYSVSAVHASCLQLPLLSRIPFHEKCSFYISDLNFASTFVESLKITTVFELFHVQVESMIFLSAAVMQFLVIYAAGTVIAAVFEGLSEWFVIDFDHQSSAMWPDFSI